MSTTARLYGGPKDGELIALEASVPYELRIATDVTVELPHDDNLVITGSIIYRRRPRALEAAHRSGEPVVYDFIGPAKRGSRR